MSLVGSWSYIQSSGLSNNEALRLYATSESVTLKCATQDDFIPTKTTVPNSEVDYIGLNNPIVSIRGFIDVADQQSGYLSVSGLYELAQVCGSHDVWYYDEVMLGASSGQWVVPKNIQFTRNNSYEESTYQVGHIIKYTINLTETL